MTDPSPIPTARLEIVWPDGLDLDDDTARGEYVQGRIAEFAAELRASGESLNPANDNPWFELLFPLPPRKDGDERTNEQRLADREATFDAIEVFDDESFATVPSYKKLRDAAGVEPLPEAPTFPGPDAGQP